MTTGLSQSNRSTTANAAGEATLTFYGADASFEVLRVDVISLDCTSTLVPEARLYRGDPSAGRLIAVAPDGLAGQFIGGGPTDYIESGRSWSVKWTGATPGSTCAAQLSGVTVRQGSA